MFSLHLESPIPVMLDVVSLPVSPQSTPAASCSRSPGLPGQGPLPVSRSPAPVIPLMRATAETHLAFCVLVRLSGSPVLGEHLCPQAGLQVAGYLFPASGCNSYRLPFRKLRMEIEEALHFCHFSRNIIRILASPTSYAGATIITFLKVMRRSATHCRTFASFAALFCRSACTPFRATSGLAMDPPVTLDWKEHDVHISHCVSYQLSWYSTLSKEGTMR